MATFTRSLVTAGSACLSIVGAMAVASCASRTDRVMPVDLWPTRLQAADVSVTEGCYRCLELALREYEAALAALERAKARLAELEAP